MLDICHMGSGLYYDDPRSRQGGPRRLGREFLVMIEYQLSLRGDEFESQEGDL